MNKLLFRLQKLWLALWAKNYWKQEWDLEVKKGIVTADGINHRLPASKPDVQEHIINTLDIQVHDVFLDIGCGAGHMVAKAAMLGKEAYGIDLSPQMVDLANNYLSSQLTNQQNYKVSTGALTFLDFKSQYFNKILINGVIHYLSDAELDKARGEIFRVLKRGGKVLIGEIPRSDFNWGDKGFKSRRFIPQELAKYFSVVFQVDIVKESNSIFDLLLTKPVE